jgi:TrmH family RNA methyltransferase
MDFSRVERFFVVLVEPKHPGNIGAVARAMGNMGLSDLRIADDRGLDLHKTDEAIARACDSKDILQNAKICSTLSEALSDSVYVAGTSARRRDNLTPLPPREVAPIVAARAEHGKVGLVFGREDTGLTIEEMMRCHQLIRIPTSPNNTSLNLSHAVQVVTYEVMLAVTNPPLTQTPQPADQVTRDALFAHANRALEAIGAFDPAQLTRKLRYFRQIIDRAQPTKDETHFLHAMFRQMEWLVTRWLKGDPIPPNFIGKLPQESLSVISESENEANT